MEADPQEDLNFPRFGLSEMALHCKHMAFNESEERYKKSARTERDCNGRIDVGIWLGIHKRLGSSLKVA